MIHRKRFSTFLRNRENQWLGYPFVSPGGNYAIFGKGGSWINEKRALFFTFLFVFSHSMISIRLAVVWLPSFEVIFLFFRERWMYCLAVYFFLNIDSLTLLLNETCRESNFALFFELHEVFNLKLEVSTFQVWSNHNVILFRYFYPFSLVSIYLLRGK